MTMTSLAERNRNVQPPMPARIDWTVPAADGWTAADMQVVLALLQQAELRDAVPGLPEPQDFTQWASDRGEAVRREPCGEAAWRCAASFERRLGAQVFAPIAATMSIVQAQTSEEELPPPGQRLEWTRSVVCRLLPGHVADIDPNAAARRHLEFLTWGTAASGPPPLPVRTFGWTGAIGSDQVGLAQRVPGGRNAMAVAVGALEGRGWIELLIPVRVAGEAQPRFVTPCTTLRDVEDAIGAPIAAIRRDGQYQPAGGRGALSASAYRAADGAFAILLQPAVPRLGAMADWPADQPVVMVADRGDADTILVAPGDLLVPGVAAYPGGGRRLTDPVRVRGWD
ncbi:hypothetical protein [Falsiroseomonas sp.]|uniref:hypothetical protein n=1 Tax=Falsiroseomonas sp. TaxID=2870721 RepID=UPI003F6F5827